MSIENDYEYAMVYIEKDVISNKVWILASSLKGYSKFSKNGLDVLNMRDNLNGLLSEFTFSVNPSEMSRVFMASPKSPSMYADVMDMNDLMSLVKLTNADVIELNKTFEDIYYFIFRCLGVEERLTFNIVEDRKKMIHQDFARARLKMYRYGFQNEPIELSYDDKMKLKSIFKFHRCSGDNSSGFRSMEKFSSGSAEDLNFNIEDDHVLYNLK